MIRLLCKRVALVLLLLALLCAAVFAESPSEPSGESPRAHLSQDVRVNQARALLNGGHQQAALEILRPLADSARGDITDIRFLIGLSAIAAATQSRDPQQKNALLHEAIAALRAILINRPQLTRVRLELARAFFIRGMGGDDDLSQEHFERVIAGKPPPAMVANIRRFLQAIRARRRWSGYFSFNIEQNDNLNSGTETEQIYLFGLPFRFNQDSRPRSGRGISFAGGREYQYPLGQHWRWRFGADASRSEYRGHQSDQTYLSFRSGPRWLFSQRGDASLQTFIGQRWLASSRHSQQYGLRFNAHHQLTRQWGINSRAFWKKTAYQQTARGDDTDIEYGVGSTYLFSPLLQGSIGVGLSHTHPEQGSDRHERNLNLGLSTILPRGWTVGSNFEWSRQRHDNQVSCALQGLGNNTACTPQRQRASKRTVRVFLLNRGLTLFGFSPQIIATQERQKSNSVLSTYQRTRWDLRFVRQF